MKQLTWKLVLPLTVISLVTVTKWWYVRFIDGPNEFLTGFPLPYVCPGWHTSLSLQIFILELTVNILTYFAFWFLIIFLISKFFKPFKVPRFLTIALISISGLISILLGFIAINPDNIYTLTRESEIEIIETGWSWQDKIRRDYDKQNQEITEEK